MALTQLPEEVLELIVDHLNVKDLLACSSVSIRWREAFNNNIFWKKFCIKELNDYLEDTKCLVEPYFTWPLTTEERLQPLCSWRIHCMRKTHLLNNWNSEKFSSSKIRPYSGIISSDLKIDNEGVHWLFLRTTGEIEVWNINTIPKFCARITLLPNCPNVDVLLAGKNTVIIQWNLVSVHDLQNNCDLLFRFIIEEKEALLTQFWTSTNKNGIELINEVDDFRFYTFENFIVGHKRIPNPPKDLTMHIWDVQTKGKVKTESMLNSSFDFDEVAFTNIFQVNKNKGLIRLMIVPHDGELSSQLYIYDFKKQKFTDTNIMFEGVVAWCGCSHEIIITFTSHPGTIKFFNLNTGKQLAERDIGIYTNSEQMQLIDSYLLYGMFNSLNIMDIETQEIVYCLEFSFYSFVRRLSVIEPSFVVVWLLERGGSPGCPSYSQEVWNLKDLSSKLFQCSSDMGYEMVTCSSSLIKQVIVLRV